jgi:hypothetical protein
MFALYRMGIYDAMMMCRADVQTVCFGLAASMGAFLLGAGTKGKRFSMPNSRIMIHQPLGGASGAAVDIEIQVRGGQERLCIILSGVPARLVGSLGHYWGGGTYLLPWSMFQFLCYNILCDM